MKRLIKKILRIIVIIISSFSLCFLTVVKNFEVKAFYPRDTVPYLNPEECFHDYASFLTFCNEKINSYYCLFQFNSGGKINIFYNDVKFNFGFENSDLQSESVPEGYLINSLFSEYPYDPLNSEYHDFGYNNSINYVINMLSPPSKARVMSISIPFNSDNNFFSNYPCGLPLINEYNPDIHLKDSGDPIVPPEPDEPIDYTSFWNRLMVFCQSFDNKLQTIIDNLQDIIKLIGNTGNLDDKSTNLWDFLLKLLEKMGELISHLFDFTKLFEFVTQIFKLFQNKLGFLFYPVTLFLNILNRFIRLGGGSGVNDNPYDYLNSESNVQSLSSVENLSDNLSVNSSNRVGSTRSNTGTVITYPKLSIFNNTIWESGSFDVKEQFNSILGSYYEIYYDFVDFSIYISLTFLFYKKFKQYIYNSNVARG